MLWIYLSSFKDENSNSFSLSIGKAFDKILIISYQSQTLFTKDFSFNIKLQYKTVITFDIRTHHY